MAAGPAGISLTILITASAPKHLMMMMGTCLVIINLLFVVDLIPLTSGSGTGGGVLLYDNHELASPPPPAAPDRNSLTFIVDDEEDWDANYQNLIGSLRERLGSDEPEWQRRLGVPVLPPQPPEGQVPTRWFNLVLERRHNRDDDGRMINSSVTVRIRGDNLYVVGFQRSTDDNQWWEFNRDHQDKKKPPPPPLIKGSKPLGFSCNYNHITKPNAAGQSTTDVSLGRYVLSEAVKQLADVRRPDQDRRPTARSMLAVIIMVSEATRFPEIANLFIDNWSYDIHLTPRMDALIRSWGDISEYIFHAEENPNHSLVPLRLTRESTVVVIPTPSAALVILGILLLPRNCPWLPPKPRILLLLLQQEGGGGHSCAEGRPLLEVISVVIDNIDGEDPGQLYGTVKVTDALGSQSIYDSDRYNYEDVSPGNTATLTGPKDRAVSAVGAVTIDLDLWDRDFTLFNPDDQVSKGAVEWDHFAFADRYDVRLSQTVEGTDGSAATVNYVVFGDAVEAKFEVTLVKGNYDDEKDYVYGRIVARIVNDRGNTVIEPVLLSTTSSHYVKVSYGDSIPLGRTIVAVPLSSHIRVSALLHDYGGYEIAGGCTYFGVKSSGTTRWRITGQSGEIEIKVNWNPSY